MLRRILKSGALYFIVLIAVLWMAQGLFRSPADAPQQLTFSQFLSKVEKGEVKTAEIMDRDNRIKGELKDLSKKKPKAGTKKGGGLATPTTSSTTTTQKAPKPVGGLVTKKPATKSLKYEVAFPKNYEALTERLEKAGVKLKVDPQKDSLLTMVLINALPILLIVGLWIFMMQSMQGGGSKVMQFGKSRAKQMTKDHPKVTFKDVAGVQEAVEELTEIKEFLSNPGKFQALGAKIPKGVLLYGPPGSGKTLLAKAVAGEAGVPFFSIAGSDFVEMFVGVGASRVRDLFQQAKEAAPSIIFMDEIDAVGRHRGAGLGGGHDEREQTLNQLLVEMDGFEGQESVIMIAATNRPDILDPALLRPGRFDRQIVVDRPDLEGRKAILEVHMKGKPLADDVSAEVIARRTPGFTGADLANLMNEAALLAARYDRKDVGMSQMEEAIDRVIAGPQRKTRVISDKEKDVIAYHEAGHALVGHVLPNTDPIHKISIIPRGRALGYTLSLPTEDKYLVSRSEMLDELAMFLGGRVAEEMNFEDVTTGAQDDLNRATQMARKMVCEYGMSAKLGPLTLGQKQGEVFLGRDFASHPDYSQEIAFEIDKEIRRLIDEAYQKARQILTDHRDRLDSIATKLVEMETIDKDDLLSLLETGAIPEREAEPESTNDEESTKESDSDSADDGEPVGEMKAVPDSEAEAPEADSKADSKSDAGTKDDTGSDYETTTGEDAGEEIPPADSPKA